MKRPILLCFLLLLINSLSVLHGQTVHKQGDPAKAVQALVNRLDRDFTHAAQAMPADKFDYTPASLAIPGANFVKVRSFADQILHVAQANYSIAANMVEREPTVDLIAIGKLKSKADILRALQESFVAVRLAILSITPANANDIVEDAGIGPDQTRESAAAWVAAHGYDHYGQLVEYLRLNGITPAP